MKTFYEFMESVATDFAGDIAPEGLTKQRADILAPMLSLINKSVALDPSFLSRLLQLLKSETMRNPDLKDEFDSLDVAKIKQAARGIEASSEEHEIEGMPTNKSSSPMVM